MAQRKRIGLVFSYNEAWIAGTYYILNIIHALKLLPKEQLPVLVIISDKKEHFYVVEKETKYPFLEFFQYPFAPPHYTFWERALNKITWLTQKKLVIKKKPAQPKIGFLYPNEIEAIKGEGLKKVNWIPDFQEQYLPEYFSEEEIALRKSFQQDIVCQGDVAVFSSNDSLRDFEKLYPQATVATYVLPFAVTHPQWEEMDPKTIRESYGLPEKYYFVPNQFWVHKNHQIVLEALRVLTNQGKEVHVAFSGKETDYRNKDHFQKLKDFVNQNHLEKQVSFLGFLDRKVQLCLMDKAIAIVQPSLFEGWSTVVEDAKALGKFLVLSHLPVHQEQIMENVQFFDPKNAAQLAEYLAFFYENPPVVQPFDYQKNKVVFAQQFLELVTSYS
ncbi:MAG: glycosyltransferase [Flavobacteriaceae bacterium]